MRYTTTWSRTVLYLYKAISPDFPLEMTGSPRVGAATYQLLAEFAKCPEVEWPYFVFLVFCTGAVSGRYTRAILQLVGISARPASMVLMTLKPKPEPSTSNFTPGLPTLSISPTTKAC